MTWEGFSCCLRKIKWRTAYLGCNGYLTGSSGHKCKLLVLLRTDQPFEWNTQEGGILYDTRWPWLDYISTSVIRQIFFIWLCADQTSANAIRDIGFMSISGYLAVYITSRKHIFSHPLKCLPTFPTSDSDHNTATATFFSHHFSGLNGFFSSQSAVLFRPW